MSQAPEYFTAEVPDTCNCLLKRSTVSPDSTKRQENIPPNQIFTRTKTTRMNVWDQENQLQGTHHSKYLILHDIRAYMSPLEALQVIGKRRKLAWFRHVTRHDSLSKTILQGTLEGGQCYGWQRKCWADNIKE